MMMRFLGNTLAKSSCGKGRLQCRDFSSVGEKVVTSGSKVIGYAYKGAFCGIGYVIGGLTTSPVSEQVQGVEDRLVEQLKMWDEHEASLDS